jgi:hypothetical protein
MDVFNIGRQLTSGLPNFIPGMNTRTQKCKVEVPDDTKKKQMAIEYCKIISNNKQSIQNAFLKSFQEYSKQMFTDFKPQDFIDFAHNNIFEYLKPIFQDNRYTQYAFLIDLKPLITEILFTSIRGEIQKGSNANTIYDIFMKNLRERGNKKTSMLKRMGKMVGMSGGANGQPAFMPIQMQQNPYQFMPMQQYPPYNAFNQQQYMQLQPPNPPPNQPNSSSSPLKLSEKDEIKKLNEVADFFKKDVDGNTVNSKILEIIKDTMKKVIETGAIKLYAPLINVIQTKIKKAVSDIGTYDSNVKVIMLVQMLDNNYTFAKNSIMKTIENTIEQYQKNPSLNINKFINTTYDSIVFPPDNPIRGGGGGKRRTRKMRKSRKMRKMRKIRKMRKSSVE